MRYVNARYLKEYRDRMYRIYITDALKAIGNLNIRYVDFIKPSKVDTRTEQEVISDIKAKLRKMGD